MKFIAALETDVGTVKDTNQDGLFFEKAQTPLGEAAIAAVCDGMGGLQSGEVASSNVIRRFIDWFERDFPMQYKSFDWNRAGDQWNALLQKAAQDLGQYGEMRGIRIGTTATAMLMFQNRYMIAHVGDSRVYEISDRLVQMTEDQTLVERYVQQGAISPEEAEHHPRRNVLLQCIGASRTVKPVISVGTLRANACYLLCSDGLRHEVTPDEIMSFTSPAVSTDSAQMKRNLRDLIELDKRRGEQDNLSALLIKAMA